MDNINSSKKIYLSDIDSINNNDVNDTDVELDDDYDSENEDNKDNNLVPLNKYKFLCKMCKYKTIRESQYERHIKTKKHLNMISDKTHIETKVFKCDCGKEYKYASGLSKHKKNCILFSDEDICAENDVKNLNDKIYGLQNTVGELLEDKIAGLERENELLIENKKLIEQTSNNTINNTTNNTTNNVNSNNNTFNLNFFLTNTCKDAMNINEFIESIEVSIEDLKYLGKNGYVDGISKLIIDKLQQIDVTKRPLHCSDLKREIIHVKDKNEWTKEVKRGEKIDNVLMEVKRTNSIALQEKYKAKYPQCMTNYNSKEHKEYNEIIYQNFGGKTEDINFQDDKILRRVSKYIEIDKNKNK